MAWSLGVGLGIQEVPLTGVGESSEYVGGFLGKEGLGACHELPLAPQKEHVATGTRLAVIGSQGGSVGSISVVGLKVPRGCPQGPSCARIPSFTLISLPTPNLTPVMLFSILHIFSK